MEDLTQYVPQLLLIVGLFLQFAVRADSGASEYVYLGWAAGLCALVYALTSLAGGMAWNAQIVKFLVWLADPATGAIWRVLAGTGATSILANIAVKLGANPAHGLIPVTDSKRITY